MERQHSLLLVEDERILRSLVAEFLRGEGYRVVEAADGPEAVARFQDSGPFDLALVDLNLPGFSGVEVCCQIRRSAAELPIMICSAAIMPDAEGTLHRLRVDHFLTKPFHPKVLLTHIARELGPRSDAGHSAVSRPASPRRSWPGSACRV